MRLRKISVAGKVWHHDMQPSGDEINEDSERNLPQQPVKHAHRAKPAVSTAYTVLSDDEPRPGFSSQDRGPALSSTEDNSADRQKLHTDYPCVDTAKLLEIMRDKPQTAFGQHVRLFLLAITFCHTCLPNKAMEVNIDFQGPSADEVALLRAAQDLGLLLLERDASSITIRVSRQGSESTTIDERYDILDVINFSSGHRRMSVVVRMPDGRICGFCKGADSALRHQLRVRATTAKANVVIEQKESEQKTDGQPLNNAAIYQNCFDYFNDFASEGLRTLLYAYRYIDESTYATWHSSYREAEISLIDRQRLVESVGEQLEQDLELLGATGIEDRLQDGVPETIDKLRRATSRSGC